MISRSDLLLLLTDLQEEGADVQEDINNLYKYPTVRIETLKKVNSVRPLDLLTFYNKIRKSYNEHHSKLYINIMRSDENAITNPETILTTLTGLLNQIFLFKCEDTSMFYKHARADEILKVINIYLTSYNLQPAYKLLSLIKADIVALDEVQGRNAK